MRKLLVLAFAILLVLILACAAIATHYTNILTNPGFESDFTGWTKVWNNGQTGVHITTNQPHSGAKCLDTRMIGTGASTDYGGAYTNIFSVNPQEGYYLNAWNKRVASGQLVDVDSYLLLRCLNNSSNDVIGTITAWSGAGDGFWRSKGRDIAASEFPAGTTRAYVQLKTQGITGAGITLNDYWDDVSFGQNRVPPTVSSLSVAQGIPGDEITINGLHFYEAPTVKFGTTNATSVTPISFSQVKAVVPVCSTTTLTVSNVYGSGSYAFLVYAEPFPTGANPNNGPNNTTVKLTVGGTGFRAGSQVVITKSGKTPIYGSSVSVKSSSQITCMLNLNNAPVGWRDVMIINDDNQAGTFANGFYVRYPAPTMNSVSPTSAWNAHKAVTMTIVGNYFRRGARVMLYKSGVEDKWPTMKSIATTKITCSLDPYGMPPGRYSVRVINDDGQYTTMSNSFTIEQVPPQAMWYLPEGSTSWGYNTYIAIENPNDSEVHAEVTYMTESGPKSGVTVTMPALSRATLYPRDAIGDCDFSTLVSCTEYKPIAVDRTMEWTGPGAPTSEAHASVGVSAPATTWYLPEGSSRWGFECWLLIQNPNSSEARCQVTYMIEGGSPATVTKTIPANSRKSFNMADDIGACDASIKVSSNISVIPERAMYRNNRREGHDSIGTTSPSQDYYLAEGSTRQASRFVTYVLIQNPNNQAATIDINYMTDQGRVPQPSFEIPPNSRKTLRVNDALPYETDVSTHVHGSLPIIAERSMYFSDPTFGEACHDSIGLAAPHTSFYFADGQVSVVPNPRETYTLVQNPNDVPVDIEILYLTETGEGNKQVKATVNANSRRSFKMADKFPVDAKVTHRAAIMVRSLTGGKKIMAERAMYGFDFPPGSRNAVRTWGTDSIGGFGD